MIDMGNVIALDNHRLLCGDAENKEDVDCLIGGAKIDLLITDPPYGIDIVNPVGGGKLVDKANHQLDHSERESKWNNRRSETSDIQDKEQWEYQQDQDSTRERERESMGRVGKPRRC